MKNALFIAGLTALVWSHPVMAGEISMKAQGAGKECVTGIDGDVCNHYFGGTDVRVKVSRDGVADCAHAKPELFLMSTRMEAPVDGVIEPATIDACKSANITVHLPKVDNPTEFRLEVKGAGVSELLSLMAYPRTLLDPLKSWASFDGNALLVKDRDGKLMDFLDRNKIDYVREAGAKTHKVTLVVGDPEDMKGDRPEGDVLYLAEKVTDVPLALVERTTAGATATVNTKLLDGLAADDPLAEKAFVKIFTMISK